MKLNPANQVFVELSELEIIKHTFLIQLVKRHGDEFPKHVELMKNIFDYINFHIKRRQEAMVDFAESNPVATPTPLHEIRHYLRNLGVEV